jgi:hypothetical protein
MMAVPFNIIHYRKFIATIVRYVQCWSLSRKNERKVIFYHLIPDPAGKLNAGSFG